MSKRIPLQLIQSLQAPRYIQSYNERGTAQGAYDQVQLQIQGQGYQNTINERQRAEDLAVSDRQREDQKFLDDPSKRDSGEKEIEVCKNHCCRCSFQTAPALRSAVT